VGSALRRDDDPPQFVASDSTLIYATGAPSGQLRLAPVEFGGGLYEPDMPPARFRWSAFSPDGRLLAMTVDATGRYEVVIQPMDGGTGRRRQVTTQGRGEPLWALDMSELHHRYGRRLYAVSVSFDDGNLVTGQPRVIFEDDR
jgi:Tol biopolymer transport system component